MDKVIRFIPESVVKMEGNKIQVIKHIRALTGHGLKEAKDIADRLFDGVEQIVKYSAPHKDCVQRASISILQDFGIKVSLTLHEHIETLVERTKDCLAICTEHEEPELLEVYAVVFKMLFEK